MLRLQILRFWWKIYSTLRAVARHNTIRSGIMSALRGTTLTGTDTLLDRTAVTAFQARLRGELLSPDDPPYEQARKVWNGMINKYPALIARCTGVADVVEAVQF